MRHFYFHVRTVDELLTDDQGQDLLDLSAARHEAELAARELSANAIRGGKERVPEVLVIADELGQEIDAFPIAAVLAKPFRPI